MPCLWPPPPSRSHPCRQDHFLTRQIGPPPPPTASPDLHLRYALLHQARVRSHIVDAANALIESLAMGTVKVGRHWGGCGRLAVIVQRQCLGLKGAVPARLRGPACPARPGGAKQGRATAAAGQVQPDMVRCASITVPP